MTKKDFDAFASIIHAELASNSEGSSGHATAESFAIKMADYCAQMNPRFKRDLFYKACGLGSYQMD